MPAADPFDTTGFGPGDVQVSSTIGSASLTSVVRSIDIKGGAMQVATIAARDAIPGAALARNDPAQFRQEGMTCWVADAGSGVRAVFRLEGGIANVNWVDVTNSTSIAPKTRLTDEANVLVGHILCQSPTVAQRVRLCDLSADDALSRPVGVATSAQPISANPVQLQTNGGEVMAVRLVAALVLALGEEIILSQINGEGTLPGQGSAPVAGEMVQRVGIILDFLGYDGAADRLVLAQLDFSGTRRIES
ncbi:hypothetical protein LCGC14_0273570 [marine sediment metagenome]|uniref:Uncharacterized protein n=2 Tax=root TaxID=1 RepID=A0A9C9TJB5_9HYPH|nr:hypothetical protein [Aurantimonas coralicida]